VDQCDFQQYSVHETLDAYVDQRGSGLIIHGYVNDHDIGMGLVSSPMSENTKDVSASAEMEAVHHGTDWCFSDDAAALKRIDVRDPDEFLQHGNIIDCHLQNSLKETIMDMTFDMGPLGSEQQESSNSEATYKTDETEEKYVNCCMEVRQVHTYKSYNILPFS
jgi:hypothetical protein